MEYREVFSSFIGREQLTLDLTAMRQKVAIWQSQTTSPMHVIHRLSSIGDPVLLDEAFLPLFNIITRVCNQTHKDIGLSSEYKQEIVDAYINFDCHPDLGEMHNHGGYCFSCVFYLDVPLDSGNLVFVTPVVGHRYNWKSRHIGEINQFTNFRIELPPSENTLLIFPSWLDHYVMPNKTRHQRVSLAFDSILVRR